jgi:pilus assembly protein CpaB
MKNKRSYVIVTLTAATGLLAGYLTLVYLEEHSTPVIAAEAPEIRLAVAAADLPLGTTLRPEHIRLVEWPGSALPAGYASTATPLLGRGLITPVRANEPLLDGKLASREEGAGLQVTIPDGMRAVSVKVDEVIGVAGFVLPGTRVDVLATMQQPNSQSEVITRAILQNVQTIAAGQSIQPNADGEPQTVTVITLLVSPTEAEHLTLAANEGRIQLALRNSLDVDAVATRGIRKTALAQMTNAPPAATAPAPVRSGGTTSGGSRVVEMYRDGVRTLSTFSPDQ